MLCLVQGKNQYWVKENYKRGKFGPPFRLDIGSQAIAKGKKREVERAKHIHQAWLTSAPKSRYLKHAKILLDLETKLVDRRAKFILDLKNISAIPILPHSCKYIRWSLYGHIRSFLSAQRKG